MLGRILLLLCLATASAAQADEVTDISPVRCAWSKLLPAQQERLRQAFTVKNTPSSRVLSFETPSSQEIAPAIAACNLTFDARQMKEFARALGAKGGEEIARRIVAERGAEDPSVIDTAIKRMHEGKRRIIGDALSCGGKEISIEWDRSVSRAMRRAYVRTVDGGTFAMIAVAMYSTFMQEGYMRRVAGTAAPCEEFE